MSNHHVLSIPKSHDLCNLWFLSPPRTPKLLRFQRGRHRGVEKREGWKTSQMTPLKKGFGPPSYGTFFHPPQVSVLCFPVQESTTEQTRSSFGGVQKFSGERVRWYVFLPHTFCTPHITAQISETRLCNAALQALELGVWRRSEIGKGCDCNICCGDRSWHMFGTSLHTNYCKRAITRKRAERMQ